MARMHALPDNFLDSRDFTRIARAIDFIDRHFREQPRLAAIASHVGLSEFHFNRLFRRWAGVTPKQYLAHVTACAARSALADNVPVLEAAHEVGLSGPGRLHDLVVTLHALTPGEIKALGAGVTIRYGFSATPFGSALIAETARGLCHLAFVDVGEEVVAVERLRVAWPRAELVRDDAQGARTAARIWSGSREGAAPMPLLVSGTNFQLSVWRALLALGAKERVTYQDLARAIGASGSERAVGNAVGANPIAWLIPCHHVLRKSGALGGYRWGEERKRAMLAWERIGAPTPSSTAGASRPGAQQRLVP